MILISLTVKFYPSFCVAAGFQNTGDKSTWFMKIEVLYAWFGYTVIAFDCQWFVVNKMA